MYSRHSFNAFIVYKEWGQSYGWKWPSRSKPAWNCSLVLGILICIVWTPVKRHYCHHSNVFKRWSRKRGCLVLWLERGSFQKAPRTCFSTGKATNTETNGESWMHPCSQAKCLNPILQTKSDVPKGLCLLSSWVACFSSRGIQRKLTGSMMWCSPTEPNSAWAELFVPWMWVAWVPTASSLPYLLSSNW